jgi:two-component sensor histidine kinase
MVAKLASPPHPDIEQAPFPVATVAGPSHIMIYVNNAFCRLAKKSEEDLVGRSIHETFGERIECIALLDRVRRSGKSESCMQQDHAAHRPTFWSYTVWPVVADGRTLGVMVQAMETPPLYERTLAINEALVVGSLRQHELTAAANLWNTELQTETGYHRQRELDAQMLTNEVSHRIKNNLQIVVGLIAHEARRASAPCAQGYEAMQSRIEAIAELYDLMSQSSHGQTVALDAYLREIARAMSDSLLGAESRIEIKINAEPVVINPNRAVPFGLMVNELATNAIKHAFPAGAGSVILSVRQIGDQIELGVADDGVGMKDKYATKSTGKHGSDYVAMFVRQLGGSLAVIEPEGGGTIVKVRFPLLAV